MLLTLINLLAGLCLLYAGAEGLVRGSTAFASRLGLTRLVIGLTVVAFGTSSPELVVSVKAALQGNGAMALGNVIGSNICNVFLILGLSALIRPLRVQVQVIRLQIPIMIGASILLGLLLYNGSLDRLEGFILVVGILAYTGFSIFMARKEEGKPADSDLMHVVRRPARQVWVDPLFIVAGLIMLITGASLLVQGAVALANALSVSQAIIGLTLVAVGTSLPELATSIVAVIKNESDIAVGNVVGSNIFNILGILGLASIARPLSMGGIRAVDLLVMIVISVLTLPVMRTGFVLSRWEGALLLAIYAGYLYYLLP